MTGRTRRLLRRALAFLALGGFPLLVVLSYRPSGARTLEAREEVAETLLRESQGIRDRLRFEDFDYSESEGDAEVYRLRAAEAIAFAEGADRMFRLKDVTFQSRDAATGRIAVVAAPRAEFVPATKAFRVFEGVRIDGEGVGIRSVSFRYDPARQAPRLGGTRDGPARRARRDGPRGLRRDGRRDRPLPKRRSGSGALDDRGRRFALSAGEVDLRRGGGFSARGTVVLKTDELLLRGDEAEREPLGEADRLSARGSVEAILSPARGGKLTAPIRAAGERPGASPGRDGRSREPPAHGNPGAARHPPGRPHGRPPGGREQLRSDSRRREAGARGRSRPALPGRIGSPGPPGCEDAPGGAAPHRGKRTALVRSRREDDRDRRPRRRGDPGRRGRGRPSGRLEPRSGRSDESAVFAGTVEDAGALRGREDPGLWRTS